MTEFASIEAYWKDRAEKAEAEALRTQIALVHAAGGQIVVTAFTAHILPELELVRYDVPRGPGGGQTVFRTRNVRATKAAR